jgi:hypothetical protein
MKYLTLLILLASFNSFSQEQEGDLAIPVSDLEIQKQEEELPPTIDEVEVRQKDQKKIDQRGKRSHGVQDKEENDRRKY